MSDQENTRGFTRAMKCPVPGVAPSTPLVQGGSCPGGMLKSYFCKRQAVKRNILARASTCPMQRRLPKRYDLKMFHIIALKMTQIL